MRRSAGGAMQPATAPAPVTPTSLRKSRLERPVFGSLIRVSSSLVAGRAVQARGVDRVVEACLVTGHAESHVERVREHDPVLGLNLAVAGLAGDARVHMSLVREAHVIGNVVHL